MKAIDNKIEQFAKYLQRTNQLNHVQFLKVRLGIQLVVSNIFKAIITYGVAILLHTFYYTLITHLTYFILRRFAHGAHAKSSLLCHIQNLLLFVAIPWAIVYFEIPWITMFILSVVGLFIIVIYAPAATKKQPILAHLRKKKKIFAIATSLIIIAISFFVKEPYKQLILYGMFLETVTLLPIFFPKEDVK